MYVNPIPHIDAGKEFEMRLSVTFDDVIDVDIKNLDVKRLAKAIVCTRIKAVYPEED